MKLLIVSDIHGSAYYTKKLIERINEEKPEKILLLGDVLYHGPRNDLPKEYNPKEVIELLNPLKDKIIAVRGNCDSEVDQMVLAFPIMADYSYINVDGIDIYLSHGHIYNEDNLIKGIKGVFLSGHTHIPCLIEKENVVCMNPGSISIPKNNSLHSYMIYEDFEFVWKNIEDGNIYQTYKLKC